MLGSSPLWSAYANSDAFGKLIFFALFALSVASWAILIHKGWHLVQARRLAKQFQEFFTQNIRHPLTADGPAVPNPFSQIYGVIKRHAVDLLNKNHKKDPAAPYLLPSDLNLLLNHADLAIGEQIKQMEKHLYILSTTVSLAPFLGLLGTVWGSLLTLGGLQHGLSQSSQIVLNGLSMALATTVIGLLVAIPALIAYNSLRSGIRDFTFELENFAAEILTSVEMEYRKEEPFRP